MSCFKILETPDDFDQLTQEVAIADWCPKKKKTTTASVKRDYLYVMTRETQCLLEEHYQEAVETVPHWKDQVQVAHWANQALLNSWKVHVLMDETNQFPLYYLILNVADADKGRIEMRGLWRSLYGTLKGIALKTDPLRGVAFSLLEWALEQHRIKTKPTTILVNARIGLERMLEKHTIKLQYVEKRIPKRQGASVHAQFVWK